MEGQRTHWQALIRDCLKYSPKTPFPEVIASYVLTRDELGGGAVAAKTTLALGISHRS